MRKFKAFLKDRYVKFELFGFYFDSDDYPEYWFYICMLHIGTWHGSLLYVQYEPDSIEEKGDGFTIDALFLKQGILWLILEIKDKFK